MAMAITLSPGTRPSAPQMPHVPSRGDSSPELEEGRLLASRAPLLHPNK